MDWQTASASKTFGFAHRLCRPHASQTAFASIQLPHRVNRIVIACNRVNFHSCYCSGNSFPWVPPYGVADLLSRSHGRVGVSFDLNRIPFVVLNSILVQENSVHQLDRRNYDCCCCYYCHCRNYLQHQNPYNRHQCERYVMVFWPMVWQWTMMMVKILVVLPNYCTTEKPVRKVVFDE